MTKEAPNHFSFTVKKLHGFKDVATRLFAAWPPFLSLHNRKWFLDKSRHLLVLAVAAMKFAIKIRTLKHQQSIQASSNVT